MRLYDRDRLYFALERSCRRRATGAQTILVVLTLALSAAALTAHYYVAYRPSQLGFSLEVMPYDAWYPAQGKASPVMADKAPIEHSEAPARRTSLPPAVLPTESINSARPNLVPQPEGGHRSAELAGKVQAYLISKGAEASRGNLIAKAQELADSYASARRAGVTNFPFPADLERSTLEQGWLWDLMEGCTPEIYMKFPPGQLDAIGCGLATNPARKPVGVGVALLGKEGAGLRPVIALVWESK